jgi:hypothetical protein
MRKGSFEQCVGGQSQTGTDECLAISREASAISEKCCGAIREQGQSSELGALQPFDVLADELAQPGAPGRYIPPKIFSIRPDHIRLRSPLSPAVSRIQAASWVLVCA